MRDRKLSAICYAGSGMRENGQRERETEREREGERER